MKLTIEKQLLMPYIGKMLPEKEVEVCLIKSYEFLRDKGIDYVKILSDTFLMSLLNTTEANINSMFNYGTLITKTYRLLDFLDIILLEKIEDVNFFNIKYTQEDKDNYYFEVIYENHK